MEDLSADSLILVCKIHFSEYSFLKKIMSGIGDHFISNQFKRLCKNLNIEQVVSSSYHHQSNGQVKECLKFIKWTIKKCIYPKSDTHVALLQIKSTLLGPGLPCLATLLFNHPVKGIMPIFGRPPISPNNNDEHYKAVIERQTNKDKNHDTPGNHNFIQIWSTAVVQ